MNFIRNRNKKKCNKKGKRSGKRYKRKKEKRLAEKKRVEADVRYKRKCMFKTHLILFEACSNILKCFSQQKSF